MPKTPKRPPRNTCGDGECPVTVFVLCYNGKAGVINSGPFNSEHRGNLRHSSYRLRVSTRQSLQNSAYSGQHGGILPFWSLCYI